MEDPQEVTGQMVVSLDVGKKDDRAKLDWTKTNQPTRLLGLDKVKPKTWMKFSENI